MVSVPQPSETALCIIVREGKRSLEEFGQFQPDDVPELVKSLGRNAPTTQQVYYSFTQQKNLQTLSFWVQERLVTNQPLDAALRSRSHHEEDGGEDAG